MSGSRSQWQTGRGWNCRGFSYCTLLRLFIIFKNLKCPQCDVELLSDRTKLEDSLVKMCQKTSWDEKSSSTFEVFELFFFSFFLMRRVPAPEIPSFMQLGTSELLLDQLEATVKPFHGLCPKLCCLGWFELLLPNTSFNRSRTEADRLFPPCRRLVKWSRALTDRVERERERVWRRYLAVMRTTMRMTACVMDTGRIMSVMAAMTTTRLWYTHTGVE